WWTWPSGSPRSPSASRWAAGPPEALLRRLSRAGARAAALVHLVRRGRRAGGALDPRAAFRAPAHDVVHDPHPYPGPARVTRDSAGSGRVGVDPRDAVVAAA